MSHPQHHRCSIRLKGYDYTQPGAYFITLVAWQRECLFGQVVDGEMRVSPFGKIVEYYWNILPSHFPVEIDEWAIMPNHFHAALHIIESEVGAKQPGIIVSGKDLQSSGRFALTSSSENRPRGTLTGSVGAILQNFKSNTTREINRLRQTPGCPVWQRNYYERVIRNEREMDAVRLYIRDNLSGWADDEENPARG